MCGSVAIFSYGHLGQDLWGLWRTNGSHRTCRGNDGRRWPFSLLDFSGALVAEQALDGVHAFTKHLVQRSRSARVQLDANLGSLAGHHLHVADLGAELRVLDTDPILALFEGRAGLTEEAGVHGRHDGVVERQDFDGRIGYRLLGLGVHDDRNHLALSDGGLEVVRDGQESAEDRQGPGCEAHDRLERGELDAESRRSPKKLMHDVPGPPCGGSWRWA